MIKAQSQFIRSNYENVFKSAANRDIVKYILDGSGEVFSGSYTDLRGHKKESTHASAHRWIVVQNSAQVTDLISRELKEQFVGIIFSYHPSDDDLREAAAVSDYCLISHGGGDSFTVQVEYTRPAPPQQQKWLRTTLLESGTEQWAGCFNLNHCSRTAPFFADEEEEGDTVTSEPEEAQTEATVPEEGG